MYKYSKWVNVLGGHTHTRAHTRRVQFCISGKTDHPLAGKHTHPHFKGQTEVSAPSWLLHLLHLLPPPPLPPSSPSPQRGFQKEKENWNQTFIFFPFALFVWLKQMGIDRTLSMTGQTPWNQTLLITAILHLCVVIVQSKSLCTDYRMSAEWGPDADPSQVIFFFFILGWD